MCACWRVGFPLLVCRLTCPLLVSHLDHRSSPNPRPEYVSLSILCSETANRWTTLLPALPAMTRSAVAAGVVAAAAAGVAADSAVVVAEGAGEVEGVVAAAAGAGSARARNRESSRSRAPRNHSTKLFKRIRFGFDFACTKDDEAHEGVGGRLPRVLCDLCVGCLFH